MKNVLFISYDGMTDPLGQSQIIPYLAGLSQFGYRFTILSCDKKELYTLHQERVGNYLRQLEIDWVSIPYHKHPAILSSIYDYYLLRAKAIQLHKKKKFAMVHTRPGIPTLVALGLKKNFGIKFLNDIRGFWADERVDGGMWKLNNPIYKAVYNFFREHEKTCLEVADHNVCLTEAARKEILSWKTTRKVLPLEVIPCSVDLDLFDPANISQEHKIKIKTELGIRSNDRVFSYLGSIGGWYLVAEMMDFFKHISLRIPDAKFLFISPHRHDRIRREALRAGINADRVVIRSAIRSEVPLFLSLSEYAVFFIKPCYSKISSSPTKHGEIMAMGIPVITNAGVGDVEAISKKFHSGIILNDLAGPDLDMVAEDIADGKESFNPDAIRNGAIAQYDLGKAVDKYRAIYEQVLQ